MAKSLFELIKQLNRINNKLSRPDRVKRSMQGTFKRCDLQNDLADETMHLTPWEMKDGRLYSPCTKTYWNEQKCKDAMANVENIIAQDPITYSEKDATGSKYLADYAKRLINGDN